MSSPRFWAVLALLLGCFGLIAARGNTDRVPPSRPLNQIPRQLGVWTSTDLPLNQATLDVLGKGVFLNRLYTVPAHASSSVPAVDAQAPVGLFIGYFPTQRTGQAIHSPQNCLPGAGWTFDNKGTTTIPDLDGKPQRVGEYLISDGFARQEVLYWYRTHGRSIANDYTAKLFMLRDAIVYQRTDAALVRVITPLAPGETLKQAHQRAVSFASQLTPILPEFVPN